jgi:hypothetical protein
MQQSYLSATSKNPQEDDSSDDEDLAFFIRFEETRGFFLYVRTAEALRLCLNWSIPKYNILIVAILHQTNQISDIFASINHPKPGLSAGFDHKAIAFSQNPLFNVREMMSRVRSAEREKVLDFSVLGIQAERCLKLDI